MSLQFFKVITSKIPFGGLSALSRLAQLVVATCACRLANGACAAGVARVAVVVVRAVLSAGTCTQFVVEFRGKGLRSLFWGTQGAAIQNSRFALPLFMRVAASVMLSMYGRLVFE